MWKSCLRVLRLDHDKVQGFETGFKQVLFGSSSFLFNNFFFFYLSFFLFLCLFLSVSSLCVLDIIARKLFYASKKLLKKEKKTSPWLQVTEYSRLSKRETMNNFWRLKIDLWIKFLTRFRCCSFAWLRDVCLCKKWSNLATIYT